MVNVEKSEGFDLGWGRESTVRSSGKVETSLEFKCEDRVGTMDLGFPEIEVTFTAWE